MNFDLALGQMLYIIPPAVTKNGHQSEIQAIHPSRWDAHFLKLDIVMKLTRASSSNSNRTAL